MSPVGLLLTFLTLVPSPFISITSKFPMLTSLTNSTDVLSGTGATTGASCTIGGSCAKALPTNKLSKALKPTPKLLPKFDQE